MQFGPDPYTRSARVKPALLVSLPAALATWAWFPDVKVGAIWATLAASGGTLLLSQLVRAIGRRRQPELWQIWGGSPTEARLRQLDGRRRMRLLELLPDQPLPTKSQEKSNPQKASRTYTTIAQFLIEKTRDATKFPLVFQENTNFGFARNLWAVKRLGIVVNVVSLLGLVFLAYNQYAGIGIEPLTIVSATINLLLLACWIFLITPDWVKVPADAYADRLMSALDHL